MRFSLKTILWFVMLCPFLTFGQNQPFKLKHLTINEGLSQNTVYATLQDSEGFIWIATEDGLNCYNGYDFKIYKHNASPFSLSDSQVNTLFEDRDKRLWVGTSDGLNIYDRKKDKFERLYTASKKGETNDVVTDILQDKKGNIWVGTFDGLKLYNAKSKTFTSFLIDKTPGNKLVNKIQTIAPAWDDMLWVGSGSELRLLNILTHQFLRLPALMEGNKRLRNSGVRCIKRDGNGIY